MQHQQQQLLSLLPKAILQHSLTQTFLADRDAVALGRTSKYFFHSLKDFYTIIRRIGYYIVMRECPIESGKRRVFILTKHPSSPHLSLKNDVIAQSDVIVDDDDDDGNGNANVNGDGGDRILPRLVFTANPQPTRRIGLPIYIEVQICASDMDRNVMQQLVQQIHEMTDFNFLPESTRYLTIQAGAVDDCPSSTRLPSMTRLNKLHTIDFWITRLYFLNQPDDGTIWPASLRSMIIGPPGVSAHQSALAEPPTIRFPSTLTELILPTGTEHEDLWLGLFHSKPDDEASALQFPLGLTILVHPCMNHSIAGSQWPQQLDSLTYLEFGERFNQSVIDWSPPVSLRILKFTSGSIFNHSISSIRWPNQLEELWLSDAFNQPVIDVKFPSSLTLLEFHYSYNHPFPDLRHTSLKWFHQPESWKQPMNGLLLPDTMRELNFGRKFNESIDEFNFPKQLKILTFGWEFKQPLGTCKLPSTLTHLNLSLDYPLDLLIQINFPPRLAHLHGITLSLNKRLLTNLYALSLRTLSVGNFDECAAAAAPGNELILPPTLLYLIFSRPIENDKLNVLRSLRLPEGFQRISFDDVASSLDALHLPSSTRFMDLGQTLNCYIPRISHTQLCVLRLPDSWNQPIDERFVLPETLEELIFGNSFNQSLSALRLPSHLRILSFGCSFSQSLSPIRRLPCTLMSFRIGMSLPTSDEDEDEDEPSCSFTHLSSLLEVEWPDAINHLTLPDPKSPGLVDQQQQQSMLEEYTQLLLSLKSRVDCLSLRLVILMCFVDSVSDDWKEDESEMKVT